MTRSKAPSANLDETERNAEVKYISAEGVKHQEQTERKCKTEQNTHPGRHTHQGVTPKQIHTRAKQSKYTRSKHQGVKQSENANTRSKTERKCTTEQNRVKGASNNKSTYTKLQPRPNLLTKC